LVLARNDWSLRQRTRIVNNRKDGSEHELTLKLRTLDLFIAAATIVAAKNKYVTARYLPLVVVQIAFELPVVLKSTTLQPLKTSERERSTIN
jgi:hypothetical protein